MDGVDEYIWRQRIHHGVRYQKSAVPFPQSVEAGLEFNVALERQEKLDLSLLTNGVMLELGEFARTVNKSETYFLFEMLEFNFDLGVDLSDERQCYDYSKRAHNKIKHLKEQIKMKPRRRKEAFPFPDLGALWGSAGYRHPGRYYPKINKLADSSVLSRSGQGAERAGWACVRRKRGGVTWRPTADAYPFCRELGVTLLVPPGDAHREKLRTEQVTIGVMLELLDFSRTLCGTHTDIVYDLVLHNFGHQLDKGTFRLQLSKKKNAWLTAEDKDAFRKKPFIVQKREPKRRKRSEPDHWEPEGPEAASKRTARDAKDYMCPVEFEVDTQSDPEARQEDANVQSCLSETKDVGRDEEEVLAAPRPSRLRPNAAVPRRLSDLFCEDQSVDADVDPTKRKLWTRRAARSKQILDSRRVKDPFLRCRQTGLDFNVASGHRRNLDLQLLTNGVLLELYKFATAMTRSLGGFLFDILDKNFTLVFQNELHQRNFLFYMTTKERLLQNHPDRSALEFLRSPFSFPEVYNVADVTADCRTGPGGRRRPPDPNREPHPFCQQMGLDLWATEERPASQKLDLAALTTGAVLEAFAFVRELCGCARHMVNDLLEHNFLLDLQGGATEASRVIRAWYAEQRSVMKRQTTLRKLTQWLDTVVQLSSCSPLRAEDLPSDPEVPNGHEEEEEEEEEEEGEGEEEKIENEKKEEEEDEQLHGYPVCQQIGLDLDIGAKPDAKAKLDPRVLTRGALLEMHRYVRRHCGRYVPALYEILEHNLDLSSQRHRKVEFAWAVASQVVAIAAKSGRAGGYLSGAVELPFEGPEPPSVACKDEPRDELDRGDEVVFVQELRPVDIEVEID
ncbi:uncharacterized protein ACO6RY_17442 [Pungitius sinensis]